jgi:NAD(P)-dependent dehydrogenase (short-subunit alcohol dehydrogenase family)
VELLGRTPPPAGPEDPVTAPWEDPPDLRRALIAVGIRLPAEIEARIDRLLAEREVRATLDELAGHVRYHVADVRDSDAVARVVADVYEHHGRLDAVIHGAGVVEDRLARDKDAASFARVFDTKVEGAHALLQALRPGTRAVVLLGSVAGVFGNRGQVDYAAANEALEAIAWQHNGVTADRVLCAHLGPWAGPGMTSPELAEAFRQRGMGLIDPEDGVDCLLRELAFGSPSLASVLLMRAWPAALSAAGPR